MLRSLQATDKRNATFVASHSGKPNEKWNYVVRQSGTQLKHCCILDFFSKTNFAPAGKMYVQTKAQVA